MAKSAKLVYLGCLVQSKNFKPPQEIPFIRISQPLTLMSYMLMAMCHEFILTYTWPIKWLTITKCPQAFAHPVAAATGRLIANPQANTVVWKRQEAFYHALLAQLECTIRRNVPGGCLWFQTVRKHFKMGAIWCLEVFVLWSYSSAFRSHTLNSNILCLKEKKTHT